MKDPRDSGQAWVLLHDIDWTTAASVELTRPGYPGVLWLTLTRCRDCLTPLLVLAGPRDMLVVELLSDIAERPDAPTGPGMPGGWDMPRGWDLPRGWDVPGGPGGR